MPTSRHIPVPEGRRWRALGLVASVALLLASAAPAQAAPGDLDPSFGAGGSTGIDSAAPTDVAIGPDGRIFVTVFQSGSWFQGMSIAAFEPDGDPDTSFGSAGVVAVSAPGVVITRRVAVDSSGRIVVLGTDQDHPRTNPTVARLQPDGELDGSFGEGGVMALSEEARGYAALAIQPDDRVVLAGGVSGAFRFARLTESGQLDPSFGQNGIATVPVPPFGSYEALTSLDEAEVAPDGSLVGVGSRKNPVADFGSGAVVRVTGDGVPDPGFGNLAPGVTADLASAWPLSGVAVRPSGRLAAAGPSYGNRHFLLAGLTPAGEADSSFGEGQRPGTTLTEFGRWDSNPMGGGETYASELLVEPGGKFVLVGGSGDWDVPNDNYFALARYDERGVLDAGYGDAGRVVARFAEPGGARAGAIDAQGRVVAVGTEGGGGLVARFLGGEPVQAPPPGAEAPPTEPDPKLEESGRVSVHKLRFPRSRSKLIREGVRALASCRGGCTLVLEVRVSRAVASRLGLRGTLLGRGSAVASPDERRWVVAKLSAPARAALRSYSGGGRLQVEVRAAP